MGWKPFWERSDAELRADLQRMADSGQFSTDAPAPHLVELDRRASERDRRATLRLARLALVVSLVGVLISIVAIARGMLL